MHEHDFDVYMISSWDDTVPLIENREQSKFITVNMTRMISPFKDIISLIRMIRVLHKLKPQIVHTHTPKAGLIGMAAAWFVRVPIRLHTVAGLPLMESSGSKRKILEWVEWLTYRCAVKVYPNSKNLREFIIENKFCKPGKLEVIGDGSSNGIDTSYFESNPTIIKQAEKIKTELGFTDGDFIFLFVGRLVKDKGIEELTQAFSELNKKYPHARLLLVGPFEPERDPLSADCLYEINNNRHIITTGFQSEIRPYLALSHALAFPSYREGFPNVPMQAGCFNLPSIVTNINGCNEIIEDRENGLVIPVKDTRSLQKAMELMIGDQSLYLHIKNNSRRMIVGRYEQNKIWKLILQEYKFHLKAKKIVS